MTYLVTAGITQVIQFLNSACPIPSGTSNTTVKIHYTFIVKPYCDIGTTLITYLSSREMNTPDVKELSSQNAQEANKKVL